MSTKPPVEISVAMSWSQQGASAEETFEVDRDAWESMTPAEREAYCRDVADSWAESQVQWGWHIYDDEDMASTEAPS